MSKPQLKIRHIGSIDEYEVVYRGDGVNEPIAPCRIKISVHIDTERGDLKWVNVDEDVGCALYPKETRDMLFRLVHERAIAEIKRRLRG